MTTSTSASKTTNGTSKRVRPNIPAGRKPAEEKKEAAGEEKKEPEPGVTAAPEASAVPATTSTATSSKNYADRMRKLPAARRIEVKVKNAADRFKPVVAFMNTWDEHKDVAEAGRELQAAQVKFLSLIGKVPDGFKPKGIGSTPNIIAPLAAGDLVSVRQKHQEGYSDVIELADQIGMTVVSITAKGKVVCKTKNGEKVVFPRGHIVRAAATSTEEKPETESDESAEA